MTHRNIFSQPVTIILAFCLCALSAFAQGTTAFTYQGRLNDAGQPANGAYDLQFALYDADANGNQIGADMTVAGVSVVNGVFTAQLDFGAAAFGNTARYLAISVRPAGGSAFTALTPRSRLTPAPYALRSQSAATADDATQLNGVAAGQYVQTNDTRLSDDRNPTAGSANYIQNGTTAQTGNLNISGNGTAGGTLSGDAVNTETQLNIRSFRALSSNGGGNFVGGINAGFNLSTGTDNTFFGNNAGQTVFSGGSNALFGTEAGRLLTSSFNTLIGGRAGRNITTGAGNVFLGNDTGLSLTTGNSNTLVGSGANITGNPNFATAIGAGAVVGSNNSVVLGRTADTVRIPGNLDVTGTITGNFNIDGANITNLNASNIATGTLNNARLGIIPLANGGTGLSISGAAGNFLRSDGANWTSSPIQLTDLPNLGNSFIQNGTTQQTGNFNISGNGTVGGDFSAALITTTNFTTTNFNANNLTANNLTANNSINAPSYSIDSRRILSNAGVGNLFTGFEAGANNTGQLNSFFGFDAGRGSTTGNENSFFGNSSGSSNGAGSFNAFFGTNAGASNSGSFNTFIGRQAGFANTSGAGNVFLGNDSGLSNRTGNSNTLVGSGANVGAQDLTFATAIGAGATAAATNTITLGRANGTDSVRMPGGMGGSLSLNDNIIFLRNNVNNDNFIAYNPNLNGIGFQANRFQWGRLGGIGTLMTLTEVGNLIIPGSISQSSDARYKTNINTYAGGLDAVMRLRGVTYNWKPELNKDSRLQIGFIAQEVETVLPELVMTDENGFKSVSYANAVPVLVEAVKEQQKQITTLRNENQRLTQQAGDLKANLAQQAGESKANIEQLKAQNAQLQTQLAALQQAVCALNPKAAVCVP